MRLPPPSGSTTSKRPWLENCSNLGAWGSLLILKSHQALLLPRFLPGVLLYFPLKRNYFLFILLFFLCMFIASFLPPPSCNAHTLLLWTSRPCSNASQINILPFQKREESIAERLQSQATPALITYLGSWNYDFEHVLDSQLLVSWVRVRNTSFQDPYLYPFSCCLQPLCLQHNKRLYVFSPLSLSWLCLTGNCSSGVSGDKRNSCPQRKPGDGCLVVCVTQLIDWQP